MFIDTHDSKLCMLVTISYLIDKIECFISESFDFGFTLVLLQGGDSIECRHPRISAKD